MFCGVGVVFFFKFSSKFIFPLQQRGNKRSGTFLMPGWSCPVTALSLSLCVYTLFPVCILGVTGGSFTQQPPPRKLGRWRRQRRLRSSLPPLPLSRLAPVRVHPPCLPFNLFLLSVSPLQFSDGYCFNIITTSSHFWALIRRLNAHAQVDRSERPMTEGGGQRAGQRDVSRGLLVCVQ